MTPSARMSPSCRKCRYITQFPTRKAIDGSGLDLQQESKSEEDVDEEDQGGGEDVGSSGRHVGDVEGWGCEQLEVTRTSSKMSKI